MKTRFLILPMLIAATLFAQGPRRGFGRDPNAAPPTPADIAAREVQLLTRFFTLDPVNQVPAVTAILTTEQGQLQGNAVLLKTYRGNLVDAIKSNDTGGIGTWTADIATLEGTQNGFRATAAAAIYLLLTPDQKTKLGNGLGPLLGGPGRGPRF